MCLHLFLNFDFIFPSLNRDRSKLLATAYAYLDKRNCFQESFDNFDAFFKVKPSLLVCVCVCFYRLVKWTRQVKINILFS